MTRITEMYYLPLQNIKSNLLLHTSLIVMVVPDFIKETNSQPKFKNGHLMFYTGLLYYSDTAKDLHKVSLHHKVLTWVTSVLLILF